MRGLPVKPRVPVRVTEREVALAPMLILKLADFHAQFLQTLMLGVDIIDLNLDIQARTGGRRLLSRGVDHEIRAAECKAGYVLFVGVEFPAQRLAVKLLAAREVRHFCEYVENALDCHVLLSAHLKKSRWE